LIPEQLILYRQHESQQLGGRRLSLREQISVARRMDAETFRTVTANYEAARHRLASAGRPLLWDATLDMLDEKIEHCRARLKMRTNPPARPAIVLRELMNMRYHRYSFNWKCFVQDLLFF